MLPCALRSAMVRCEPAQSAGRFAPDLPAEPQLGTWSCGVATVAAIAARGGVADETSPWDTQGYEQLVDVSLHKASTVSDCTRYKRPGKVC